VPGEKVQEVVVHADAAPRKRWCVVALPYIKMYTEEFFELLKRATLDARDERDTGTLISCFRLPPVGGLLGYVHLGGMRNEEMVS
jgi:hypothetical protein